MIPIYNLSIYVSKCIIEVTCNALLLFRKDAKNGFSISYPFNTELIEKENQLKISLYPTLLDSGVASNLSDISITGSIKVYSPDEVACPENGTLIQSIDFTDTLATKEVQTNFIKNPIEVFPIEKSFYFDNNILNFSNRLILSETITDQKILLDYAEKIRDIIYRQDLEALYFEYKPKLDDYVIAYPNEFSDPMHWFGDFFQNDFFPGGPLTGFKRDDIGLKSWCGGRIWEIFVKPYEPFFSNEGLDGDINTIEMYVGKVDGNLKIVR